jgi:hypothetical protein
MSLFGETPNIVSVMVGGVEVSDDFDLDKEPSFEAMTDAGNRYLVRLVTPAGKKPRTWEVFKISHGEPLVEIGRVHRQVWSSVYQFTAANSYVPAGSQGNLWNAVQSLLT